MSGKRVFHVPDGPGVYRIVYLKSGRSYVGATTRLSRRWAQHRDALKRHDTKRTNRFLQKDYDKYGLSEFAFEVLEECEPTYEREQFWMDQFPLKYNECNSGPGNLGHIITSEMRAAVSAAQKGKIRSPESRAKQSASLKGHILSPETIAKMIAARKGYTHSPETRAKISASNKGRTHSPETKAKMSVAQKGVSKSPEHLAALRVAWAKRKAASGG